MSSLDAAAQEQIRNALARILSSDGFSASARNRKLLEYVVSETLAGRADRINPTDNLTPRDFTLLVPDDEDQRFGTAAIRARSCRPQSIRRRGGSAG